MKSNFAKSMTLVLALLLLVASLAACAGKATTAGPDQTTKATTEKPQGEGTTAGAETTAEAPPEDDPFDVYAPLDDKTYEISWAKKQQGNQQVDMDNANIVWHFEEALNIKFDIQDYFDENDISLRIASGDKYDFIETRSAEQYTTFVEDGLLLELPDELFVRYAPEMWNGLNDQMPGFFDYGLIDGKRYSVGAPSYLDDYHIPIVWRKPWLDAVGTGEPPTDFDEFESILYAFTFDDPDGNGKDDTYGMSDTAMQLIFNYFDASGYKFGQTIWHEDNGDLAWGAIRPGAKDALGVLAKWYDDGIIDPEFITSENKGGYWAISHTFNEARIGLSSHGYFYHWTIPSIIEEDDEGKPIMLPESSSNFNEIYNLIGEDAQKEYVFGDPLVGPDGVMRARAVESSYWGVLYGMGSHLEDEEPDKIGKILNLWAYVNCTDLDTLLWSVYGEENVDWEYTEYGSYKGLNPIPNVERGGNTLFHIVPLPSLYKQFLKVRYDYADDPANKMTNGVLKNKFTWTAPSLVKSKAELDKIQAETFIQIITGEKPLDYFDEFVDIWMSAGGEEYTREVNDWYAAQPK